MKFFELNLQLFAAGPGTVTNYTGGTVNSYTGVQTTSTAMSPTMKTYYDTELLENTRAKLIFVNLGKKQSLPKNHGRVVEWRKFNTLPKADKLKEGVIPDGTALGMTSINVEVAQYGKYFTVSDRLEMEAVDDVILGGTEELSASCSESMDLLTRNVLSAGTALMYADVYNDGEYVSTPATRTALLTALGTTGNVANVTADMINKVVTAMKKAKAPFYAGNKYLAIIHPSCTYDLRNDPYWVEAHKYSQTTEIFNGEIGELHGVRFIESPNAPVIKATGATKAIYQTIFLGRDAFSVVDPDGAGLQMIIKGKGEIGGPLEQFSTVGCKFETAAKILYPERMMILESGSSYSTADTDNMAAIGQDYTA